MVQVKEYDGSITDKQKKALIFMAKESPYNGCDIIKKILTKQIMKTGILLILRSFQRKGLCNSSLKAKSTTFAYNNK